MRLDVLYVTESNQEKAEMIEVVSFRGHSLIRARHKTTMEVTKEGFLTQRGDCIIGILADKSASDLSREMRKLILEGAPIRFTIVVGQEKYSFMASGSRNLKMDSCVSMVIRKSNFVDGRTVAVNSSAAACDIPRSIIKKLREGEKGKIVIEVKEER